MAKNRSSALSWPVGSRSRRYPSGSGRPPFTRWQGRPQAVSSLWLRCRWRCRTIRLPSSGSIRTRRQRRASTLPRPLLGPVHVPRRGTAGVGQRCRKASRGRRFVSRGRRSALRVVRGDDSGLVYRPLAGAVQRLGPLRSWRSPPPGRRQCGKTSSTDWGRVMRSSSRLAPTSRNCAWKWSGMNLRTRNAPPSSSGVPSSRAESMTIRHTSAGTAGSVALRGIGGVYHTL